MKYEKCDQKLELKKAAHLSQLAIQVGGLLVVQPWLSLTAA